MNHILFTADQNYAVRIPVVIKSIQVVHPKTQFHIHLISDGITEELKQKLSTFTILYQYEFSYYPVQDSLFSDAPVNKHYSKAMYYRMLAHDILPNWIDQILYLDPDILVINSLLALWNENLTDKLYAAASHISEQGMLDNINRIRLETTSTYFNTGVLMINLALCRQLISTLIAVAVHHDICITVIGIAGRSIANILTIYLRAVVRFLSILTGYIQITG